MTPEPGIYEDVPFADYLAWDALSNSGLSLLKKSPRHFKLGFSKEPQPYLLLGSLYHCGVLEPLAFAKRYAIVPDFHLDEENVTTGGVRTTSRATKYVKERTAEYASMCDGREIVPNEWYEQTLAVVRELSENDDARRILNGEGPRELSIIWEEDGVLCKARIDKKSRGVIADLKSTAAIDNFTNAIGRYGYHRQMAHYQAGWRELTGDTLQTWLIAVESSHPFAVQAAPMSEEAMEAGYTERRKLLDLYCECRATDNWPGMPNPKCWHVPAWAVDNEPLELVIHGKTVEV